MTKITAQKTDLPADIAKLSFEDAMVELESIVKQLEGGKASLEQSIGAYERGALLKKHCEAKLFEAQMRVEKISLAADGTAGKTPKTEAL